MGYFSRQTFDILNHYVSVRLKQGVPLVDADWNEREDIRKYELQAFLKWFVGNGIPLNNDGFRILPLSGEETKNDFIIKGGDGTPDAPGRCLVEGWDVINKDNLKYTAQPLYNKNELAEKWGVAPLLPLKTPQEYRVDTIYLDIWEREVDAEEDNDLIDPVLGVETSVRIKREWVVRVAEDTDTLPTPPDDHVFYPLARLERNGSKNTIEANDIMDLRLKNLALIQYDDIQQITHDAFGQSYTLNHDGQMNLSVSIRDAINALLRNDLPYTAEEQLTTNNNSSDRFPYAVKDKKGDIWVFWQSDRGGNADIWYNHYRHDRGQWSGDTQLTTHTGADIFFYPHALADSHGDVWVIWKTTRIGVNDIFYNRYSHSTHSWQGDTPLTKNDGHNYDAKALEDKNGNIWVFWKSGRRNNKVDLWCNRYSLADDKWLNNDMQVTLHDVEDALPFPLLDSSGNIWVFWHTRRDGRENIYCKTFTPDTETWSADTKVTTNASYYDVEPFAIEDNKGNIWVFWRSDFGAGTKNICYKRYLSATQTWERDRTMLTDDSPADSWSFPLIDSKGDIWVFWYSNRDEKYGIWFNRYREGRGWDGAARLTLDVETNCYPVALEDDNGAIWVFWFSRKNGFNDLYYRKIVPML